MKKKYTTPEIKLEALKKQDVLLDSETLVDNHTEQGSKTLIQDVLEEFFGI